MLLGKTVREQALSFFPAENAKWYKLYGDEFGRRTKLFIHIPVDAG
jgi:hypothetical protein